MTDFFWKLYFIPQISSHLLRNIHTVYNFRIPKDTVLHRKAWTSHVDPKILNLLFSLISQKFLPKYTSAEVLRLPEMEPHAAAHPPNDPCVTGTYLYTIPWGFRSLLPEHRYLSFMYKRTVRVYVNVCGAYVHEAIHARYNFPQGQFSCL